MKMHRLFPHVNLASLLTILNPGCINSSDPPATTDVDPGDGSGDSTASSGDLNATSSLSGESYDETSSNMTSEETGSASTDPMLTGDPPTEGDGECGDGEVNEGESCDHGDANSDDGPCLSHCQLNVCGDGFVFNGVEACDDGNVDNFDDCLDTCEEASCGDGYLHYGVEECEQGEIDMSEGNVCQNCAWVAEDQMKLAFISSVKFLGNFQPSPEFLGDYTLDDFPTTKTGFARADQRCQQLAGLAGLTAPETFRAWLSDNNGLPESDAMQRLESDAQDPYFMPDGPQVANSLQDLLEHGPLHSIDHTEQGETLAGDAMVWTNTAPDGTSLDLVDPNNMPTSCDNWHTDAPGVSGQIGAAAVNLMNPPETWTDLQFVWSCSSALHLYCFQR